MTLVYYPENCTDCGACDHHYQGIRDVARIHQDLGFSPSVWSVIGRLVGPAVDACKVEALVLVDAD